MRIPIGLASAALLAVAPAQDPGDPAPRHGVAGVGGLRVVSSVSFATAPQVPHTLEAVYVFPDRARFSLRADRGLEGDRRIHYRFGDHAWVLEAGSPASDPLDGFDRSDLFLHMAARRALFHWPHGFAWTEDDGARVADVPALATDAEATRLGMLRVTLDDAGRPKAVAALYAEEDLVWTLEVLSWTTAGEGSTARPAAVRFRKADALLWTERVGFVGTREFYVDDFFRPPDRRAGSDAALVGGDLLRDIDLRAITYRRVPLDAGTGWPEAERCYGEALAAAREELGNGGPGLDPTPTFELDDTARPTALVLRLAEVLRPPPVGWRTSGDRPGAILIVGDRARLDAARIALLRERAPEGSTPGTPYVRFSATGTGPRFDLCLPYQAER